MKRQLWGCLPLLLFALLAQSVVFAAASKPRVKEVLVLYSLGREFSPFNVLAGSFHAGLVERKPGPIEFHEIALESARSSEGVNEQPLVDYLQALSSNRHLDLVVAMGGPATLFVDRHRDQLFAGVPVISTLDMRRANAADVSTNVAMVPLKLNLPGLIEDMLQVLPATTNVLVVLGAEPLSRYWTDQCKREFARFTNRIAFAYCNDLSLEEIGRKVKSLPPHSAILYGTMIMDAAGVPHEQESALLAVREAANAPIFGAFEHQLGLGIVGGRLISNEAWGQRVADAALRILNGEPPSRIVEEPTGPGAPMYDCRELERWGIGRERLPAGAEIRFREPTPWEEHRSTILGGMVLIVIETVLIATLIFQLRRRHRAEASARESARAARELSGRLIHTQEEERSRIARDLHDDFNQRLALLSVEIDLLGQKAVATDPSAKLQQLGEHVRELSSDVHQLAYQLHPAKLDQLGLVAAVSGLCRDLSQKSGLKVEFSHDHIPRELPADVARCVFRVVQESLQNVVRHSGAKEARLELAAQNGNLRLVVSDEGRGFDMEAARKTGGLGLLSMRERVRLSQGHLDIQSSPGQGTQIKLTIPLPKKVAAT